MNRELETLYTVTELAGAFGITPRAIRYYETKGLLQPRRIGTHRAYCHRDRARLQLVLRGKQLGFSLADIAEYIDLYEVDSEHVEQQQLLLRKVRARIAALRKQQQALEMSLDELQQIEAVTIQFLKSKRVDHG